jgi:hypothetical protein
MSPKRPQRSPHSKSPHGFPNQGAATAAALGKPTFPGKANFPGKTNIKELFCGEP